MVHRAQDEVGDERHPETLGDQAHDGHVVLGLVGDVRPEPGVVRQLEQVSATARAAGDPRFVGEHREVDVLLSRHTVALGHGEAHLVVEQVRDDELVEVLLAPADVGALVGKCHGEVALASLQCGQALGGLGLGEGDADVGEALLDQRQRARHQGRRRRGEGHEPHPPAAQSGDCRDLFLSRVDGREHRGGVAGEHLAGLGEADVAADPLDEHGAGALLEAPHHLRDRRLRVAQRGGGRGEAALVGDGLHDPESCGVDHARIL